MNVSERELRGKEALQLLPVCSIETGFSGSLFQRKSVFGNFCFAQELIVYNLVYSSENNIILISSFREGQAPDLAFTFL